MKNFRKLIKYRLQINQFSRYSKYVANMFFFNMVNNCQ